jgi:predicted metal-binding membrane protein
VATTSAYPLPRQRTLILGTLLVLAALAWALLLWQLRSMDRGMATTMDDGMAMEDRGTADLTAGMGAPLFLAMWVTMMVAMMFPTAAPMILTFARISAGKQQRGQPFVATWVFVAGYLVLWAGFGVLAYLAAVGAERLAEQSMWLMEHGAQLGGVVLILAGLYQLSPLKDVCLGKCRSPMAFILQSWRDGTGGAFRMGLAHGLYCLGCCWLLFVLLFPLGIMNVAAMALITLLIFTEKSWLLGRRVAQSAAVALVAYGALVLVVPDALPTML